MARLIPGVLGNDTSAANDSFQETGFVFESLLPRLRLLLSLAELPFDRVEVLEDQLRLNDLDVPLRVDTPVHVDDILLRRSTLAWL